MYNTHTIKKVLNANIVFEKNVYKKTQIQYITKK